MFVTAQSHSAINHLLVKSAEITESDRVAFIKYGGTPIVPDREIGHLNTYRELAALLSNHLVAAPHMSIVLGITVFGISKLYNEFAVPKADYLLIDEQANVTLHRAKTGFLATNTLAPPNVGSSIEGSWSG